MHVPNTIWNCFTKMNLYIIFSIHSSPSYMGGGRGCYIIFSIELRTNFYRNNLQFTRVIVGYNSHEHISFQPRSEINL